MKQVQVILVIAVALALQTTLARFLVHGPVGVDLVLVAVVYLALSRGPTTGLLSGTLAGLAQDSLASGIIGIGGLAKTVVGYLVGVVGTAFIVTQPIPRFVIFFAASVLQAAVVLGLQALLGPELSGLPVATTLAQALGNALIGVVLFQVVEAVPGIVERRRSMSRTRIRR